MCGRWAFWLVQAVVPAMDKGLAESEGLWEIGSPSPPKQFSM